MQHFLGKDDQVSTNQKINKIKSRTVNKILESHHLTRTTAFMFFLFSGAGYEIVLKIHEPISDSKTKMSL